MKKLTALNKFKLNIQLFAVLTAESIREQIKDLQTPEEIQAKLIEIGAVKAETKETIKEHTQESVTAFLQSNTEASTALYNSNVKTFLASKLGKKAEEITEEDIKAELVTKGKLDEEVGKYNTKLIDNEISKHLGTNYELLKPHIKVDTIKIDGEFKITGLDEQVTSLKTNYPDLFKTDDGSNPGGGSGSQGGSVDQHNPWTKEHWDETKQVALFQTNQELAETYMKETGYDY